jgi:hypothetical protein
VRWVFCGGVGAGLGCRGSVSRICTNARISKSRYGHPSPSRFGIWAFSGYCAAKIKNGRSAILPHGPELLLKVSAHDLVIRDIESSGDKIIEASAVIAGNVSTLIYKFNGSQYILISPKK